MSDILIYSLLFFLLSPGLLLNIPGTKGDFFEAVFTKPNAMGGVGLDVDAVFMTRKTSLWSILAHTLVFMILAYVIKMFIQKSQTTA